MSERMVTDVLTKPDAALEMTLRPSLFSDFTGQPKVKERIEIAVQAARQRGECLDHILLSGPPGLGYESARLVERRGPPDVVAQQRRQLRLEGLVATRLHVALRELLDRGHQRLGHEAPAVLPEVPAGVRIPPPDS